MQAHPRWSTVGVRSDDQQRQLQGVKVGLQHNIGLGGAAVVTIYRKAA